MDDLDYEQIVALHSEDLYRFAFSLAGKVDEASELTQETYCKAQSQLAQLRDPTRARAWLWRYEDLARLAEQAGEQPADRAGADDAVGDLVVGA